MTKDGVIAFMRSVFRTQERNRADAIDRLLELLRAGRSAADATSRDQTDTGFKDAPASKAKNAAATSKAKRGLSGFDD